MNKLIDEFVTNLGAGDIWVGFLMLAIFYILKKEPFKVFTYFSEQKSKDIDQAKALLESEKLCKESNELLREHLEHYTFHKYYGISANKDMRSALLKFYQKHQDVIGWHDLRRAFPYTRPCGTSIKVKISWYNHLSRWSVTLLSWFMGLYSILIIAVTFISKTDNGLQFFALTGLSVFLLITALFFSTLNWPYHSAIKIQACSESSNNKIRLRG